MNRLAFIFLIIGYGLSLFGELYDCNKWKSLVIIQIESVCILFIAFIISKGIAFITFKEDIYIDYDSLKGVETFSTDKEIKEIMDEISHI